MFVAMPGAALAQTAEATEVSGNAFGISAGGTVTIAPTPSVTLPATGGTETDSVASFSRNGVSTGLVNVTTTGSLAEGASSAEATVDNLLVSVAGVAIPAVTATSLTSTSQSVCGDDGAESTGDSVIEGLEVAGQPVNVTGEPNQRVAVDLPLGAGTVELIINEQVGGDGDLVVNALRATITVAGVTQTVTVAQAGSDIVCADDLPDTGGTTSSSMFPLVSLAGAGLIAAAAVATRKRTA
jgi:LPXTG-motif cell wall-anchored protein